MWQGSVSLGDPVIASELKSGESLLWSGQPRGGIRLRPSDALFIPFSLLWGGFAIVWEVMALFMALGITAGVGKPGAAAFIFPLFGLPFVLVGLYLMIGRFFVDAKSREKTRYAVTDQRIIIVTMLFGHKVQSIALRQIPELVLNQSADGSGSIHFGSPSLVPSSDGGYARRQAPGFEMIERVREVYDIVQNAQQRAR
jgi:hypothetical protein